VKKGKTGSAVRAGIGQAIVYTTKYDFVIYLFVDTSEGAKIKRSRNGRKERYVLNSLWENYNIHFSVLA